MIGTLSDDAAAALRREIDAKTSGPSPQIPGLLYLSLDKAGNALFRHVSGVRGIGFDAPMTYDTIFYMASFTKLITSIACMQMVEQGKLHLDDAAQVLSVAPELGVVQVLERHSGGNIRKVPKEAEITLRMLLTHTVSAGFGYAFEDPKLRDWALPTGLDDFSGIKADVLDRPLVNQPGSKFQYGTSMDWVGVLIERTSGLSLEEYFRQHIFESAGIKDISFYPTRDMKGRLAYMHQRQPDGTLSVRSHLYRAPLVASDTPLEERYCMAGAGCYGSPIEFCELLATLLNDGTSPKTKKQLLRPETVTEMFRDQIPDKARDCNEQWPSANPQLANGTPLVLAPEGTTEGWGLSFSLSHQKSLTGRAAGAGSWEGLPNLFWFVDRDNGIAGMIASQILPYGDLPVIQLAEHIESQVYQAALGACST
ncbi:hypothetical protein ANO11243_085050 [Dothideomycetidae sp. 11243]|nr:hypothetical protein ANO11243_085050 [fungal sp. No.11243]